MQCFFLDAPSSIIKAKANSTWDSIIFAPISNKITLQSPRIHPGSFHIQRFPPYKLNPLPELPLLEPAAVGDMKMLLQHFQFPDSVHPIECRKGIIDDIKILPDLQIRYKGGKVEIIF